MAGKQQKRHYKTYMQDVDPFGRAPRTTKWRLKKSMRMLDSMKVEQETEQKSTSAAPEIGIYDGLNADEMTCGIDSNSEEITSQQER